MIHKVLCLPTKLKFQTISATDQEFLSKLCLPTKLVFQTIHLRDVSTFAPLCLPTKLIFQTIMSWVRGFAALLCLPTKLTFQTIHHVLIPLNIFVVFTYKTNISNNLGYEKFRPGECCVYLPN